MGKSLVEKAIEDWTTVSDADKALILSIEMFVFRLSEKGKRITYGGKFTKSFKNYLNKLGLICLVKDIELKEKECEEKVELV